MLKNKVNTNKILAKTIQVPNIKNTSNITITIHDAVNLAEEHFHKNLYDYAVILLEKIITAAPKFVAPYLPLSMILQRMGNKIYARQLMTTALKLEPNNVRVLCESSSFFSLLYENEYSFRLIEKALKLAPQNAAVLNQYGTALVNRGEFDRAINFFKKAINLNPQLGAAYHNLAAADINAINDELLEKIFSIANGYPKGHPARVSLLFAAARKLAQLGRIDAEFDCLNEANGILRTQTTWTWQHELQDWRTIESVFTKEFVKKIQLHKSSGINPIILSTLPRSGTTLIETILSSHSKVSSAGESHLFHGPAIEQSKAYWGDLRYYKYISPDNASSYLEAVIRRAKETMQQQDIKTPTVTDKTIHNYYTLGVILAAFPEAKVIHVERDPLDICLSCYQLNFTNGAEFTTSLSDTARTYNIFNAVMDHWKHIFPGRIYTIQYEKLVGNSEFYIREMLEFCNLEWEEQCLRFYEGDKVIQTASLKQVRNPINKKGLQRWKKYAKHLTPAIEALNMGLSE